MYIVHHACPNTGATPQQHRFKMLTFSEIFLYFLFLAPLGTLLQYFWCGCSIHNPAPSRKKYPYNFITVLFRAFLLLLGSGLQDFQQLWIRPADNLFTVRPIPTGYGPYAMNLPLLGFNPRLPQLTLAVAQYYL
jgi:hypothetical protein